MFTIIPYGQGRIPCEASAEAADLLASVVPDTQLCEPSQRPFVQLSHQELPENDVEAVLGYAGITTANAPVGLPSDFEPRKLGRDCLIFPLPQLEAHLRRTQPEVIAEYERHSSLEQFLESRDIPARDYLVTGLLECIKWCYKHRAALTIRW
jgi:hypothetical protein